MKIWIFNHDACMPSTGPLLRHFYFAKELNKRGHEVLVFASNHVHFNNRCIETNGARYIEKVENRVKFIFVKTTEYQGNGIPRIKNMLSYYFQLFPISKELFKKYGKPDVIIGSSVHPLACVAGIKIARKISIPCLVEIRDLWPEAIFNVGYISAKSIIGRFLSAGEKWIYYHGDGIIFTKEGDADHIKEMKWDTEQGGKIELQRCYYINNGVNIDEFNKNIKNSIKDEDLDNENTFKFIYTGTIRKVNNVDQILDAAKLLLDYSDISFLIYGTGNQVEKIQKRIEDERIRNVKLKGFIDKKYIPYVLSKASANLLNYSPTQYNWARGNSSNKLFEYMASGKPVISTVKMGYSIIDRYHCGFSLENYDAQSMADAILSIYFMKEEKYNELCNNALKGAKDFDIPVLVDKLEEVLGNYVKNN